MKRKTGQKGFTMVELIIVVAIIAILAVVGIQAYGNIQATAQKNVAKSNANLLAGAINQYNALETTALIATTSFDTNTELGALFASTTTVYKLGLRAPVLDDIALTNAVGNIEYTAGAWRVKADADITPMP